MDLAQALARRRQHRGLGSRLVDAPPWPGERLRDRWAERPDPTQPLLRAVETRAQARQEAPELPPDADLDACRRPFQLWNVVRMDQLPSHIDLETFPLEPQPPYRLGYAPLIALKGRPAIKSEKKATRLLRESLHLRAAALGDQALKDSRQWWALILPFGREGREDAEDEQEREL